MIKVLQISKYMYPYIGGIEQVARDVANALSTKQDIQQKIICFNDSKENVYDVVDGVDVVRCGCITKICSQPISLSYKKELKRLMNEYQPDIIVFHYPNPFVASLLLKHRKKHFKLFIYWHLDITKQKILGKLFHRQNIALINRADKVLGATPKHINESAYTKYFEGKKEILPYTIDEKRLIISNDEIKKAQEIKKTYEGKVICFFIGRHVPYKGLEYLIKASKLLKDEKVQFIIAGKGELTESLMRQAKGDDKIEFIGKITDSEWRMYLYACDIFCFPSITRNEAFGLALAEGMYYGKPAVTFTINGSGVNYVNIDGETGIECENANVSQYANALKKLITSGELREQYGKNAKKRIEENFMMNSFQKNVINLIQNEAL